MSVCTITYVARGYWQRANVIADAVHTIPHLSLMDTEDAMDACTEIYHMPAPDWLQNHAKRFSERAVAKLATYYETLLDQPQANV